MSNLFAFARQQSQPLAKLYWRASGTSTPQNVYSDVDLQVAHPNPLQADADGIFPPIYLDPSLPDYRVIHTDGSDPGNDPTLEVQLEDTLDDIPASSTQSQAYRLRSTAPTLIFEETDGTSNAKKWRVIVDGGLLKVQTVDDAEAVFTDLLSIDRDGSILDSSGYPLMPEMTGSFTGTLSGMTGSTTGTIHYRRNGGMMTLYVRSSDITGTSNSGDMTLTGMPSNVLPKTTRRIHCLCSGMVDNGATVSGYALLYKPVSTYQFSFGVIDNPSAGFTNSGTKGLLEGAQITYFVDNPSTWT